MKEGKLQHTACYLFFLGQQLPFHIVRTGPGLGNVTVEWKIVGHNVKQNFESYFGTLFFPEVGRSISK